MNVKLYDQNRNAVLVEKEYLSIYYTEDGDIKESVTQLDLPIGKGYYREIYFENVHIGFGDGYLSEKIRMQFESSGETVEMYFALKGKSKTSCDCTLRNFAFDDYQHNIVYSHQLRGEMEWMSEAMQIFEINISPPFFDRFLSDESTLISRFREALHNRKTDLLDKHNQQISYNMYQLIQEILNCNRKGIFKRIYLEAKVIELILLQLEQFTNHNESHYPIPKADVERMYAVKEYMLENIDTTSSLIELAHMVGTNEFKLKKGFKELFGTTVFGFWNDAKMEQAKEILHEGNKSISDVAELVGYKNSRHFATAFKKKFGVVPSYFRK
ncbi:AraC family transcriptional regulator [Chryseobacterium sp. MYb264]|uniref:AraC family transcriptional regulator n=1 Tax=Chryseobacterium sp. MYb264 TaxID=2745153 RepID=UPI002E1288EA|nr:AraC family transcriptional regulator [Chryseobacterium sp. MYb264]